MVGEAESSSKETRHSIPGIDKCWGRAAIACGATLFSSAVHSTSGFFYVAFMREYGVNHAAASWPISVFQAVDEAGGVIAFFFLRGLAVSTISMIGGVLLWSGLLASLFAPDMTWMSLTFGVVQGAGDGLVSMTVTVLLMMYFDKYRGVATGIRYAGYSLSSLLCPPILERLDRVFPFRQLVLIFSGITMNVTPFVLALKEPPWTQESPVVKDARRGASSKKCIEVVRPHCHLEEHANGNAEPEEDNVFSEHETSMKPERTLHRAVMRCSTTRKKGLGASKNVTTSNACTEPRAGNVLEENKRSQNKSIAANPSSEAEEKKGHRNGCHATRHLSQTRCDGVQSSTFVRTRSNLHKKDQTAEYEPASLAQLVVTPTFWVVVLGAVLAEYTDCTFLATLVDSGSDRGATRQQADLTIACSAPSQLLGRAVVPLLADVGLVSRTTLACVCYFLFAAAVMVLALTRSFATYAPCAALASLLVGCLTTMKHVITADYFGVDVVPTAWAATGAILLPLLLSNPFIIGFFRDQQGSYDNLYYSLGSAHLFMGILFLCLRCFTSRRTKSWMVHSEGT